VDVAVLETARGGLLREGLGFTEADVGAVLNIAPDHLGLKGVDTLDDLAAVKSLIVETVASSGASVLNADDPLTVKMARRAGGRLVWFSLEGGEAMSDLLREHVGQGGMAVVREPGAEGGCLVLHRRGRREVIMPASDIPATIHGAATFNVANALAAAAICAAQDVPLATIRAALANFHSTFEQNPGRLNIHDAHGVRVIFDYVHNAAGLTAIGEMIAGIRHLYRRTAAVLSTPGDRRDEDIIEMGRLGAGIFDRLYFREDPGNRGRPRGEVMALMRQGALASGVATLPEIELIVSETDATAAAMAAAEPGDLILVAGTDVPAIWKQITEFQPMIGAPPPKRASRLQLVNDR
jgi:cyanophycin synthetase